MKKRAIAEKTLYFLSGGLLIILLWYHFMHLPISQFDEYGKGVMNNSAEGLELYFFYYLLLIVGVSFTIIGIAGLIKLAFKCISI